MRFDNPQFDALANFPVRFCVPVFFGDFPTISGSSFVSNGSGCIVKTKQRTLGITCHHVVDGYRSRRQSLIGGFSFGPFAIEPDDYLIAESRRLDVATLDLTELVQTRDRSEWCEHYRTK